MTNQVMLDLETLGNKPGSVIVAIGAVKFGEGKILDTFYERVDAKSCVEVGLKMDPDTVMWWLGQGDAARLEITKPGAPLATVLTIFAIWLGENAEVWGNGATFDNVLLADAYDITGLPRPWRFSRDRCFRTVSALRPDIAIIRGGTHHNALDDAKTQAEHLMKVLAAINPPAPLPPTPVTTVGCSA
ncbi:MAG TPA: 3'-5' exonuclease [Chthoniobacteraceae bacterium]|jgi:exodeoxyribonuclease VIII|nr:3'-5' exonuclease [Chthoniobacteraceae bacterium]